MEVLRIDSKHKITQPPLFLFCITALNLRPNYEFALLFFYFVSLPQYFQNVCTNVSTLLTQARAMVQNILETVGAAVKVEKDEYP